MSTTAGEDPAPEGDDARSTPSFDAGSILEQAKSIAAGFIGSAPGAEETVEGSAGGGLVCVEIAGGREVARVHIDPSVVDPAEVEMLEDLVRAALQDALAKMAPSGGGGLGDLAESLSQSLAGLDLGSMLEGLSSLFGGGSGAHERGAADERGASAGVNDAGGSGAASQEAGADPPGADPPGAPAGK